MNKSTLDSRIIKEISDLIRKGYYSDSACAMAGVPKGTFYSWMQQGHKAIKKRDKGEDLTKFETMTSKLVKRVLEAESHAEAAAVDRIRKSNYWQSDAWYLERRWPHKWGQKTRTEHTGKDGVPIRVERVNVQLESPEMRETFAELRKVIASNRKVQITRGKTEDIVESYATEVEEQEDKVAESSLERS